MRFLKHNLVTVLLSVLSFSVCAQMGSIDSTFGVNGVSRTDFHGKREMIRAVEVYDKEIYATGYTVKNSLITLILAKYDANGKLQESFAKDATDYSTQYSSDGTCMQFQKDGKILVGGYTTQDSTWDFLVRRYNKNGDLDNSYGDSGEVILDLDNTRDVLLDMKLQEDQKLVSLGSATYKGRPRYAICRHHINGELDSSFGLNGKLILRLDTISDYASSVSIQKDGKILIAGTSTIGINRGFDFKVTVIRLNIDGSMDKSFGKDGVVSEIMGELNLQCHASSMRLLEDGKILVVASTQLQAAYGIIGMMRLNSNGTLDKTFKGGGKFHMYPAQNHKGSSYSASSIAIQKHGGIIVGGIVNSTFDNNFPKYDFQLNRFHMDGELDSLFGDEGLGRIITNIGSSEDFLLAMDLQTDNFLIAAGTTSTKDTFDFTLTRYHLDWPLGQEEMESNSIIIYPNPVTGKARISYGASNKPLEVAILDLQGRVIKKTNYPVSNIEEAKVLDFTDYPTGFYLVKVSSGQDIKVLKVHRL